LLAYGLTLEMLRSLQRDFALSHVGPRPLPAGDNAASAAFCAL
jgi:hypothetical protein